MQKKRIRGEKLKAQRAMRAREIRDIFNKLRKKYNPPIVHHFFLQNYFIGTTQLYYIIRLSDSEPVDIINASITYHHAMKDEFHL